MRGVNRVLIILKLSLTFCDIHADKEKKNQT